MVSVRPPGGTRTEDLARTTLAVFFMVGVAAAALLVLSPFMPALLWATMIVVATWPLLLRAQQHLWQRRSLAVLVMTTALLLTFVIPFLLAGTGTTPATVGLVNYIGGNTIDWGAMAAASLTLVAPVVVLTVIAQRGMLRGLSAGAVKG